MLLNIQPGTGQPLHNKEFFGSKRQQCLLIISWKTQLYLNFSIIWAYVFPFFFFNQFELVFLWFEMERILTDSFQKQWHLLFPPPCTSQPSRSPLVYWQTYSSILALFRNSVLLIPAPLSRIPSLQELKVLGWKCLWFCLTISRSSFTIFIMKYFRPTKWMI